MKMAEFNTGTRRKRNGENIRLHGRAAKAKKRARRTGDWTRYKALKQRALRAPASDPLDPDFRRLTYVRYADDFLLGVIGSKADADALKTWLGAYLETELHLELSAHKTLITHASERVRFLGYDIKRWSGMKILRYRTEQGTITRRTTSYQLELLLPDDKRITFVKGYGDPNTWHGEARVTLLHLSELEILMTYNAEIRGFLGYYALADNLKGAAVAILWLTTTSFLRTLARKRRSSLVKVARSLKRGPSEYVITADTAKGETRTYRLVSSTTQVKRGTITYGQPDAIPTTMPYKARTELGRRLLAQVCEWCGTRDGPSKCITSGS